MKKVLMQSLFAFTALLFLGSAHATIDSYEFDNAAQEQQFFELTNELRCPKCQNQTIGDSNAPIAQDLRREVHRMVVDGADNDTVIDFMLARYGDFVLYKPRWTGVNLVLWLGPVFLLLIGLIVVLMVARKHKPSVVNTQDAMPDEALTEEQERALERRLQQFQSDEESGKPSSGEKEA
ncbi:cytochrome c-type biogenesis protein [Endozoicomonas ascidiicola]|uniref:cytochrome c-type biogenesis protein n=1 Tax=Endozoicomonas ascidiicola TaxID=1698521 RepID=UPI00082E6AC0|nr:cytochrome c-type biogenesis protein [Endozoicomonas ascidiicola]